MLNRPPGTATVATVNGVHTIAFVLEHEFAGQKDLSSPGLKDRICDEGGEIRRFVNVFVNGEDVRFLAGLSTDLKTGDEVSIVPAVAGG